MQTAHGRLLENVLLHLRRGAECCSSLVLTCPPVLFSNPGSSLGCRRLLTTPPSSGLLTLNVKSDANAAASWEYLILWTLIRQL